MSLIIEDGTKVSNSNSYVTTAYAVSYLAERGLTFTDETESYLEQLAITAKDFLEQQSFLGYRQSRDQALQFPRIGVCVDGWEYGSLELPPYLLYSQVEIMYAIDQGDSPLSNRVDEYKSVKAGPVNVVYRDRFTGYDSKRIDIYLSKITVPEQLTIERR